MKNNKKFTQLTPNRQWLLMDTMNKLDQQFDYEAGLIGNRENGYGVRTNAHYALGLLARAGIEDIERASKLIEKILSLEFEAKEKDIYYGVFKRSNKEKQPAIENYPGMYMNANTRYYLDKWQELILEKFKIQLKTNNYSMEEIKEINNLLNQSVVDTIPVVWKSYDPNWREFIGTIFALILSVYEELLDANLVKSIEESMKRSVIGSISRYESNFYPMNTNVELMHIFISIYYGERLDCQEFIEHGIHGARTFIKNYKEYHGVAEYNSPTYYSVDFMILSAWRQFTSSRELNELGTYLEAELWKDMAKFYNPELKNLCGPFSRGYEMDMKIHTMIPSLLYIGLDTMGQEKPEANCEQAGNIDIALLGTKIPDEVKEELLEHKADRQINVSFRELIERGAPDDNTSICTATAWISRNYMLGALKGSRNTSGQLRSAVAYWKAPSGTISYLSLFRREPLEECEHMRTILFHNQVEKNRMEIEVEFQVDRDVELYFEVVGEGIGDAKIHNNNWIFPGMEITLAAKAPKPDIRQIENGLEIIYLYKKKSWQNKKMYFQLQFAYGID